MLREDFLELITYIEEDKRIQPDDKMLAFFMVLVGNHVPGMMEDEKLPLCKDCVTRLHSFVKAFASRAHEGYEEN